MGDIGGLLIVLFIIWFFLRRKPNQSSGISQPKQNSNEAPVVPKRNFSQKKKKFPTKKLINMFLKAVEHKSGRWPN